MSFLIHFVLFSTLFYNIISINIINAQSTIKIGEQVWTSINLDKRVFRNNDSIFFATSESDWMYAGKNKIPACCYYGFDEKKGRIYGLLYNYYAVNDQRGLAPNGFHIPEVYEWDKLISYLGGDKVAGKKLKSKDIWPGVSNNGKKDCNACKEWSSLYRTKKSCEVCFDNKFIKVPEVINKFEDNTSGFGGLPGGYMGYGLFHALDGMGCWWSTDIVDNYPNLAHFYYVSNGDTEVVKSSQSVGFGYYVRCIKNAEDINLQKKDIIQEQSQSNSINKSNVFLTESKKLPGMNSTKSGLLYKVIKETYGKKPLHNSIVEINYTGKLTNGKTVFGSKQGAPEQISLGKVVKGLQEGIQLMSKGAKFIFILPSELGYGEKGVSDLIGANEILLIEVELLDF